LKRQAELIATSRADELALRALAEFIDITTDQNVRVVGGQMAALLVTAFPVPGVVARRTRDADAAITTELAASGILHDRLVQRGYSATSDNSYTRPVLEFAIPGAPAPEFAVDLLVPSADGRFQAQQHGGRLFDAAPGLKSALEADPIEIDTRARLLDGALLQFAARVPTVDLAVVIKSLSYASRLAPRDIEDIYRLLEIANTYRPDEIGGWRLRDAGLPDPWRDAAFHLHDLAGRSRRLTDTDVPLARLATLIAALVIRPR
jgi:hypothetical protein